MTQPEPRHRQLIARLEADRARLLASSDEATIEEVRIATSALASGYLHAIAVTVLVFEGARAVEAYLEEHSDGRHLIAHQEPS